MATSRTKTGCVFVFRENKGKKKGDRKVSKFDFFIRRFHSLIALVPLGMFLCVHFLLNSAVFISNEAYLQVINFMKNAPFIIVLELVLIAIPILFHGIYGIYIAFLAKNNAFQYRYYRNLAFYLQRLTGFVVLAFLICHVYTLRIAVHSPESVMAVLMAQMQNPLILLLYIAGVVGSVFHLTNGLFTFCITWGICVGDRAQKIFALCAVALFVVMSVWAVGILLTLSVA